MKSPILFAAALFALVPAMSGPEGQAAAQVQPGQTVRGNVLEIIEGDTYEVIRSIGPQPTAGQVFRVRLWGADAPAPNQPYGPVAVRDVRQLVGENRIEIAVEAVTSDGVVARVRVGGEDLSERLLRSGLAWHDPKTAPFAAPLKRLERAARQAQRGLWSQPNPVPPWEWNRPGGGAVLPDSG